MNQEEQWLLEEKYNGKKSKGFFCDLELLRNGTPLAYLIGSIPFLDCAIYIDSHPLIPRVETEYWTEKAIESVRTYVRDYERKYVAVLDLCAGSGAIGVAVAKAIPETHVTFGEIDLTHLPTIQKNLTQNTIAVNRYSLVESDLFEKIPGEKKYEFILTNPPYIDPAVDRAEKSVKLHEPDLALYGGVEGMECIQKIIAQDPAYLTTNGQLWIEHEPEQSKSIQILAQTHGYMCATHRDQYAVERYSILVLQ
ncbi:MAG: release factor glutamine methyltransferase [Acidimicrobiales bacterium]|jgi:release factor glutamine methyltransferase